MATVTETSAPPRRVESSLLVVEEFRDSSGTEWRVGDRASLARHGVREAVMENPERFLVEFETVEITQADLDGWIARIVQDYEQRYRRVKEHRDGAHQRREQALRAELAEQQRSQPELERRFKDQEKERAERVKRARSKRERRQIENALEFKSGPHDR